MTATLDMPALGRTVVVPVLCWMGAKYATAPAVAMLLAIARVESDCCARKQMMGPARGLWQFERQGGVAGVRRAAPEVWAMARVWGLPDEPWEAHQALAVADIPACILARGLLWTLSDPLPALAHADADEAYRQYLSAWRPGRPCGDARFGAAWREAVDLTAGIA